ncbi:MAG TPA: hypothetical protein VG842_04615 [Sediminibacterium sp.]|jgi:hypothetical protein|nr:hypothetical protein [Chitinophagaceae bacterium]HVZ25309.1 hypothetical protein [Sediminibacterium sp.]
MPQLQLIRGRFSKAEALDLITQMVHVKIRYHEDKIRKTENEEDIKMRESRIKQLQKDLYELRKQISENGNTISLTSQIEIV